MPSFLQARKFVAAQSIRTIFRFPNLILNYSSMQEESTHTKITAGYLTQWCVLINKNGSYIK